MEVHNKQSLVFKPCVGEEHYGRNKQPVDETMQQQASENFNLIFAEDNKASWILAEAAVRVFFPVPNSFPSDSSEFYNHAFILENLHSIILKIKQKQTAENNKKQHNEDKRVNRSRLQAANQHTSAMPPAFACYSFDNFRITKNAVQRSWMTRRIDLYVIWSPYHHIVLLSSGGKMFAFSAHVNTQTHNVSVTLNYLTV
ncbi:CLUMA_CG017876, isoform A [Clunio marinus]|uniref:CLUMA_CG017876, isoform A n=1 Tax=Clunio marinus TaxID=568069 RepID=A0A1J1IXE5_9DIPT|nr:CLUMA_CG017876, isoform A [Clunio marinus]